MTGLDRLPGVTLLQLDVTDGSSIKAAVAAVLEQAGRIDILVGGLLGVLLSTGQAWCRTTYCQHIPTSIGARETSPQQAASLPVPPRVDQMACVCLNAHMQPCLGTKKPAAGHSLPAGHPVTLSHCYFHTSQHLHVWLCAVWAAGGVHQAGA